MNTGTNPPQPPHAPRAHRVSGIDGSLPAESLPKMPSHAPRKPGVPAAAPHATPTVAPSPAPAPAPAPSSPSPTEGAAPAATPATAAVVVPPPLPSSTSTSSQPHEHAGASPLALALVLSLATAVSLGITRFAYGLLLPPMRQDLAWSYALAGGMNTANAVGYLLGALSAPGLMRRWGTPQVLVVATAWAALFMAASGFFLQAVPLMLQRLLAGVASAWVFVAAGVLAARLGSWHPQRSGLLLGVVYGGVGWGIVLSAVVVPVVLSQRAAQAHAWTWAWWWLALACALICVVLLWPARWFVRHERAQRKARSQVAAVKVETVSHEAHVSETEATVSSPAPAGAPQTHIPLRRLGFALAGYTCFGMGYIGYMTFVIALLRDRGVAAHDLTLFYALLGGAVVASSRLWARLLDKAKAGGALAFLNALLGVATVLPAVVQSWPLMLASGVLFGAVFLSVVASTTALVRHHLPSTQWPAGISAFTIVFALGQIIGPSAVGWIADGAGGLERGLLASAIALWCGAALAWRQGPVALPADMDAKTPPKNHQNT